MIARLLVGFAALRASRTLAGIHLAFTGILSKRRSEAIAAARRAGTPDEVAAERAELLLGVYQGGQPGAVDRFDVVEQLKEMVRLGRKAFTTGALTAAVEILKVPFVCADLSDEPVLGPLQLRLGNHQRSIGSSSCRDHSCHEPA